MAEAKELRPEDMKFETTEQAMARKGVKPGGRLSTTPEGAGLVFETQEQRAKRLEGATADKAVESGEGATANKAAGRGGKGKS